MRPISRIFSGVLGAALLVFGLWLSLISVIVGIVPQSLNPYVMDGDPCCGVPDTWAETREMAFGGWLWLGLRLAVFITGTMLIAGAARGRRLKWRWLPISVVAVMAIAGAAIVVAYLRLDELPQVSRCREAGEQMKRYPSTSGTEREELSGLIRPAIYSLACHSRRCERRLARLRERPIGTIQPRRPGTTRTNSPCDSASAAWRCQTESSAG